MEQNLWTLFSAIAGATPDREALASTERRLTFKQLADRAARFAGVLHSQGIAPPQPREELARWESGQDLVGTYLLNGPAYVETLLGSYAARAAPFNVNYRYVANELDHLLNDARAAVLVYHARFAPVVAEVRPRLRRTPLLLQVADCSENPLLSGATDYETALADASPLVLHDHSPDDLYVLYTGGTTGMPKGVLWRQHDLWEAVLGDDAYASGATTDDIVQQVLNRPGRRVLPNAPLMHGAGQWTALRALLEGDCVVINGVVDRLDPVDVWKTVERERVNSLVFVGEAFARPLLDELEGGEYDTSSIAVVALGGAFTSPETKERIVAEIPQALVADVAGSSESGGVLRNVSSAGTRPQNRLFSPMPGAAVLDDGLQRLLEPGEETIGWLAKRGPIPLGYLGDKDKTIRTFPVLDGTRWAVPGDKAKLRDDGMIELLGRDAATINSAGEKIFAEEVEAALLGHPAVRDAIVVGRPSERWGEEVVAIIELLPGTSAADDEILATASERLARFKLPKTVLRVDRVFRSPSGKADYGWGRQIAEERSSR